MVKEVTRVTKAIGNNPSAPELPGILAARMGFVLGEAARRLDAAVRRGLAPLGIHPRHYAVLALLRETGPLSQQEIGRRLAIDRTTMVYLIDDLEKRGLVVRDRDPGDRRKYAVSATGAARNMLREADNILATVERRFLATLSPAERRQLYRLLERLL